jgi:hypothetical protein
VKWLYDNLVYHQLSKRLGPAVEKGAHPAGYSSRWGPFDIIGTNSRPVGGVYTGIGLAIGSGVAIGGLGLYLPSKTYEINVSSYEDYNAMAEADWSHCDEKCKCEEDTGMGYLDCMSRCMGAGGPPAEMPCTSLLCAWWDGGGLFDWLF